MLIVMESRATEEQTEKVIKFIKQKGFDAHVSKGEDHTVIGAVGRKVIDKRDIELLSGVKEVIRITSPYKLVSRVFKPEDTIIELKGVKIGGGNTAMIAGPCSVESYEQVDSTAKKLAGYGVKILRGGAFKPRTSPYAFQGLGEEGLKILREVADKYDMLVTSEVMEVSQIPMFLKYVDILQVGARNMQNFNLLKSLGEIRKPVLLKRGLSAMIEELLMSAEYIMAGGNREVILCERGIRTFEHITRNTLDLSAIPVIQKISHLPIVVDPSHATGLRDKVAPMSKAAIAAGADGLIIEVHNSPDTALCDGAQSLYPEQFAELYEELKALAVVLKKKIC
ncbi:MAG: bifunctional 3-deoxy-7-phosphoheptulonate synthase/chorismate mutase [Candidatus Gastranaerophilales bacterium]|nr:bifunctional 3-deoxy-7-phosphoheptulonate synthase/chorismate mutase [Candidatus Gastranaerophilales bacterium]